MTSIVEEGVTLGKQLRSTCADLVGDPGPFDPLELRTAIADLLRPESLAAEVPPAVAELVKVWGGTSEVPVPSSDRRFADPAWRDNRFYRRLGQSYRVCEQVVSGLVDRTADGGWQRQERARLLADIAIGALAPVNLLPGNPAAVKRAVETGGMSMVWGMRNFVRDIMTNGAMPTMVDTRPFTVGKDVACTPGSVVYREEMFELIQYAPTTATVHERPLLAIPPQINRHYIFDLAPGRSLAEYAVAGGVQTFTVVWRNPTKSQGRWGLDDYLGASLRAVDIVRAISGSDDVNVLGLCSGGLTNALLLGYLSARGLNWVRSATQLVTMLDSREPNVVGALCTPRMLEIVGKHADRGVVYDAGLLRHFAWLRANDLVYGYLVHDWVLGQDSPEFDILAWNSDSTRVPCAFLRDTLEVLVHDRVTRAGEVRVLDTPIDLSEVGVDTFHVAGERDHISRWRACFRGAQLFGGERELVLTDTGHIGTLVNPVGESRHHYRAEPLGSDDSPESWRDRASERAGSWWPHWIDWLIARSGDERPAPEILGDADHPALVSTPGDYVRER